MLNQCETSSFKLAEEILKFDDDFLSRLLKLYSSRVLHVTQHTLKTLVCLCQTTILQDELGSENCKHLLHWMLINKSEILLKDWKTHLLPIDVLSRALVGLIIRTKLPATENIGFIPKRDPYRGIKSLKSCYVNSYEDNLIDYVSELQNGSQKNDFIVNWMEPTCVEFIQLLFRDTQLLLEQNTDDIGDFCIVLLHHSTLLIELGSLLELLHFPSHERIFGFLSSILNKLEQLIESLFLSLKKIPAAMIKDIIYYVNLFGSRSKAASKKVAEFLFGHSIRPLFLRCLWTVINHSERSQLNSGVLRFPLDYKSLNEKNRLQVDAMQAITLLVCPSAICMKQDFSNLISLLDALSKEDIRMPHILQMYIILLEEVSKMSVMDDMVVMKVLYSIRFVCITWSKVYCVAPVLLNVLRNMVFHVWTSSEKDNSTNFLILITQLFQRINSKRFGTEVTYEFVELLGCFIKNYLKRRWMMSQSIEYSVY
ncbi:uncharacterized protein LOC142317712 isoform X2 [Lycorma delicatula]|uniref:uncharacterized protein LOC142317712 isoform X2 n=1 Tax=Lycorma delicatula TaxID=130591 RepID=UPI003F519BDD